MNLDDYSIEELELRIEGDADANVTILNSDLSANLAENITIPIGSDELEIPTFYLGGIPLASSLTISLDATFFWNFTVTLDSNSGAIGAGFGARGFVAHGIRYDPIVSDFVRFEEESFEKYVSAPANISVNIALTIGVTLTPTMFLKLEYIGGPYSQVPITTQLVLSTNSSNLDCIQAVGSVLLGVNVGLKVDIEIVGHQLYSRNTTPLAVAGPWIFPVFGPQELCIEPLTTNVVSVRTGQFSGMFAGQAWSGYQTWIENDFFNSTCTLQLVTTFANGSALFIYSALIPQSLGEQYGLTSTCNCVTFYLFEPHGGANDDMTGQPQYQPMNGEGPLPGCSSCEYQGTQVIWPAKFEGSRSPDFTFFTGEVVAGHLVNDPIYFWSTSDYTLPSSLDNEDDDTN